MKTHSWLWLTNLALILVLAFGFAVKMETAQAGAFGASVVEKSPDAVVKPGGSAILWVKLESNSTFTWEAYGENALRLGTIYPRDRSSRFYTFGNWITPNRVKAGSPIEVNRFGVMDFGFKINVPSNMSHGIYKECFAPVWEHNSWLDTTEICWNIHVSDQGQSGGGDQPPVPAGKRFLGEIVGDSQRTIQLYAGETGTVSFAVKNTGDYNWSQSGDYPVHIGTMYDRDHASDFYTVQSWLAKNRPGGMDEFEVAPGEVGHFTFQIKAPSRDDIDEYSDYFWLVAENKSWFEAADQILSVNIIIKQPEIIISEDHSKLEASHGYILNDGVDSSLIEIKLMDEDNQPIADQDFILKRAEVNWSAEGSNITTEIPLTTDSNGEAEFLFASTTEAWDVFTLVLQGAEPKISASVVVVDELPIYDNARSTFEVDKENVTADGVDEAIVTLNLRDRDDNPVKNQDVVFEGMGCSTFGDGCWLLADVELTTDNAGMATYSYSSKGDGNYSISYSVNNESSFESVRINFRM